MRRFIKTVLEKAIYLVMNVIYFDILTWHYNGITIKSNKDFYNRTVTALDLIRDKDPINYNRVKKYLKKIIYSGTQGVGFFPSVKTYSVSTSTLSYGLRWYASCLVHESIHAIIWDKKINTDKMKIEKSCTKIQIRSLIRLGEKIDNPNQYLDDIMKSKWWTIGVKRKRSWLGLKKDFNSIKEGK